MHRGEQRQEERPPHEPRNPSKWAT
jgi:hypothetical protein